MPGDTKLMLIGPVETKNTGVNPKDGRPWCNMGFMLRGKRLTPIELFMPDGFDHSSYFVGTEVELPVRPYVKDGNIRYVYDGDVAQAVRPKPKAVG